MSASRVLSYRHRYRQASETGRIINDHLESEYLNLLRTGEIKEFNIKRKNSGNQTLNFEGIDLSNKVLKEVNLQGVDLAGCKLNGSQLTSC